MPKTLESVSQSVDDVRKEMDKMDKKFDDLEKNLDKKFDDLDKKIDKKIDKSDAKFQLALEEFTKKFDELYSRQNGVESKFNDLYSKQKEVESPVSGVDANAAVKEEIVDETEDERITRLVDNRNKTKDEKDGEETKFLTRPNLGTSTGKKEIISVPEEGFIVATSHQVEWYGLNSCLFWLPADPKYGVSTNAIDINDVVDRTEPYLLYQRYARVEKKFYAPGIADYKKLEFEERRNRELMQLPKSFDSSDLLINFDEYLEDFWRACVRLNIENHMAIKYALFDHLDTVSKTLCSETLDPGRCAHMSVYEYLAGLRGILLPLNDLSSAKLAYETFAQNDLTLDLFFEKKYALFKRCHAGNVLRRNDYWDFLHKICDSLTNKSLALEVRKMSKDIKCNDHKQVMDFRKRMISLGETLFQSIASSQMEDYHKNTLITQSMLNTFKDSSIKEQVAHIGSDSYAGYDENYGYNCDTSGLPNYDSSLVQQQDQVDFGEDDWLVSIAAAERDTRSCFYCFQVGHLLVDCPDLKKRIQPHRNSLYHPANKGVNIQNSRANFSPNDANVRGTNNFRGNSNSFRGNYNAQNFTRSSYPSRGGFRGNYANRGSYRGGQTGGVIPYNSRRGNNGALHFSPSYGAKSFAQTPVAQCTVQDISVENTEEKVPEVNYIAVKSLLDF